MYFHKILTFNDCENESINTILLVGRNQNIR